MAFRCLAAFFLTFLAFQAQAAGFKPLGLTSAMTPAWKMAVLGYLDAANIRPSLAQGNPVGEEMIARQQVKFSCCNYLCPLLERAANWEACCVLEVARELS